MSQTQMFDRKSIVKRLHSAGHHISPQAISSIWESIHENQLTNHQDIVGQIIKKMTELSIVQGRKADDTLVKECLISVGYKGGKYNFVDIVYQKYKTSVGFISPYEYCTEQFFIGKPHPSLFEFKPEGKTKMYLRRFTAIRKDCADQLSSEHLIGILYQKIDYKHNQKALYLQNESNTIRLDLTNATIPTYVISGAIYIARGSINKSLTMTVEELSLPPIIKQKQSYSRQKFNKACQEISKIYESYNGTDIDVIFNQQKLLRYGFYLQKQSSSPVLILGNITLNNECVLKVQEILEKLSTVQVVILLLANDQHTIHDLSLISKNVTFYIMPHLCAAGPQILPKIPLTKDRFMNCSVLTNPARFSICGKNVILTNYPMVASLNNKNLYQRSALPQNFLKLVGQFIFSQNNVSACHDVFWQQSTYMDIQAESHVFITDIQCPQGHQPIGQGKTPGSLTSVGHWNRDLQFVLFDPKAPQPVQICCFN